jgi:hypothetical protein
MLDEASTEALLALPETGMGFQFVEATVQGARKPFLVFNSQIAYDVSDLQLSESDDPASILLNGTRVVFAIAGAQMNAGTLNLSPTAIAAPRTAATGGGAGGPAAPPLAPTSATVAPPSSLVTSYALKANRFFHRCSAFKPDKRVDPLTGNFLAGTYATTDSDFPFVPSGFAAVGRYALPNILPAWHHYQIEAPAHTPVTFGTVAPAFGQAGGGVEALFVNKVVNAQSPAIYTALPED